MAGSIRRNSEVLFRELPHFGGHVKRHYHGLRGQPITHTLFRKNTNHAHRLPGTRIIFMGQPMPW